MATQNYMTGEDRAVQEAAELEAAEQAFNGVQEESEVNTEGNPQGEPQGSADEQPVTDWEKRYKDLQSFHDKTTNELKGRLKEAGVEEDEADKVAELEQQLSTLREKEEARETQDVVAQAQEAVGSAHPDFVSIINSPDFAVWIKEQPQMYHDAIYADRPDARISIDALTLYKVQSGFQDREQKAQLEAERNNAAMNVTNGHNEAPSSDTKKVWSWNEINALTASEYDKLEKEIDTAISEGRVR